VQIVIVKQAKLQPVNNEHHYQQAFLS